MLTIPKRVALMKESACEAWGISCHDLRHNSARDVQEARRCVYLMLREHYPFLGHKWAAEQLGPKPSRPADEKKLAAAKRLYTDYITEALSETVTA